MKLKNVAVAFGTTFISLLMVSCLANDNSNLKFGWDNDSDAPSFGWDKDLEGENFEAMSNSTSASLTKFLKANPSCEHRDSSCLKFVLRLPVDAETDLGVDSLVLNSFAEKSLKDLHENCQRTVSNYLKQRSGQPVFYQPIRTQTFNKLDAADCAIEIYNKKLTHKPATKLNKNDIGLAFTLNLYEINKSKKGCYSWWKRCNRRVLSN